MKKKIAWTFNKKKKRKKEKTKPSFFSGFCLYATTHGIHGCVCDLAVDIIPHWNGTVAISQNLTTVRMNFLQE